MIVYLTNQATEPGVIARHEVPWQSHSRQLLLLQAYLNTRNCTKRFPRRYAPRNDTGYEPRVLVR